MNKKLLTGAALAAIVAAGLGAAKALAAEAHASAKTEGARRRGRLGLSSEQREKLKEAGKQRRQAVTPLRQELRAASQTLREQLKAGASDKELEPTLAKISSLKTRILACNDAFRLKADALLTPTQRAKILMSTRRRHHKSWRSRAERSHPRRVARWRR